MPEQLKPLDAPYEILYLWQWFCELSNSRQYSELGAMALSFLEIKAWAELTHSEPTAQEISVLKQIDRAYLTEVNKK